MDCTDRRTDRRDCDRMHGARRGRLRRHSKTADHIRATARGGHHRRVGWHRCRCRFPHGGNRRRRCGGFRRRRGHGNTAGHVDPSVRTARGGITTASDGIRRRRWHARRFPHGDGDGRWLPPMRPRFPRRTPRPRTQCDPDSGQHGQPDAAATSGRGPGREARAVRRIAGLMGGAAELDPSPAHGLLRQCTGFLRGGTGGGLGRSLGGVVDHAGRRRRARRRGGIQDVVESSARRFGLRLEAGRGGGQDVVEVVGVHGWVPCNLIPSDLSSRVSPPHTVEVPAPPSLTPIRK